jgi:CHAP domain
MLLVKLSMATAAVATGGLLMAPFLVVGGGMSAADTVPSTTASADCTPVPAMPGVGPWYVGGNVPPPALPYVPSAGYPDGFCSPAGECTTWAAYLWPGHGGRGVTWSGDAWEWLANAAAQGYATSGTPSPGAIVVWPRRDVSGSDATRWGHVAVVLDVGSTSYTVTEMNVVGQYRVDIRVVGLPGTQAGFIPLPTDALPGEGPP